MHRGFLGLLPALAAGLVMAGAAPAIAQQWRIEAESALVTHDKAVSVVQDADASGGQALAVPAEGVPNWNVVYFGAPAEMTPGRYRLTATLKLENAADIGKAWRLDVRGGEALLAYGAAYGLYLKNNSGYQPFSVDFTWTDPKKRPAVYMRWTGAEGKPALRLDRFEFTRLGELPPLRIARVWPDRIRYKTKENGTLAVTVENLSATPQQAQVSVTLQHDLDAPRDLGAKPVSVEPGKSADAVFELRHGGGTFGYAARATLTQEGRPVDEAEEYFCVHDNPWAVATGARDEEVGEYYSIWGHIFYGIGATDPQIEECALRARQEYTTCAEFFSWSPGEAFGLVPEEPIWVRGNGGDLLRSQREVQHEVAALKKQGIGCITYIAYQAMGRMTVKMVQQRPEWFLYSPDTGDHIEFYGLQDLEKQKAFWAGFDWKRYKETADPSAPGFANTPEGWKAYQEFWKPYSEQVRKMSIIGYFVPNYSLPEVVDYCADQAVRSAKLFGWDGLRWDCGHLNTGPIWGSYRPFLDFYGRPLAKTPEEMVKQTVANLRRLKARIRKQLPDYAIGTNYGSWMETHTYPEMTKELARDGGWLLDEFSYGYNAPQSPYHWWDKYYAIMADEGEYVTSLGGHYNPFSFNRGGGKYPADRLYETIFRLAGKGHPNVTYYNSRTPAGNYAQLCVRFGRFLFEPELRRVEKPEEIVSVSAPAPLWWNKTVQRLRQGNQEYLVVHLINPPVAKEVETDADSRLNPPVEGAKVAVEMPAGKTDVSAWALTAESWKLGEAPKTQAVPLEARREGDRVSVTVPQVLYWKTLVFRFR